MFNAPTERVQGVLRAQRRAGVSGKTSRDPGRELDLEPEEEKDGPSGRRSPDQCAEGFTLKIDLNTCLVHSQEDWEEESVHVTKNMEKAQHFTMAGAGSTLSQLRRGALGDTTESSTLSRTLQTSGINPPSRRWGGTQKPDRGGF